jgi:MFS family permease
VNAPASHTGSAAPTGAPGVRLGLRENLPQFTLLVAVNMAVGGLLGTQRVTTPLLGAEVFALGGLTTLMTFIMAFGLVKAVTNFFAGTLSDRYGRKPVLVAGWLVALPIPALLIWAPDWWWVIAANVLLGVNQRSGWGCRCSPYVRPVTTPGSRQRCMCPPAAPCTGSCPPGRSPYSPRSARRRCRRPVRPGW